MEILNSTQKQDNREPSILKLEKDFPQSLGRL